MIKVTVESIEVTQREGQTRNNKPFPREQTIYVHLHDKDGKLQPHPTRAKLTLWDGVEPYKPGPYILAPQSVYVDRYGNPALAPKLVPVASGRGGA